MYRAIRNFRKDTNGYYIVRWRSEPYIFKDDNDMKGCKPSSKAYAGEIVWDTFFLHSLRLKEVLLSKITMMVVDKIKKLPHRCNIKQAEKIGRFEN